MHQSLLERSEISASQKPNRAEGLSDIFLALIQLQGVSHLDPAGVFLWPPHPRFVFSVKPFFLNLIPEYHMVVKAEACEEEVGLGAIEAWKPRSDTFNI